MVTYLAHHTIDKDKWDHCILHAANRLIYAQSACLDAIAGKWDALVLNDYEAVMPLTWRKKFFITYLYQPAFIQQLGIFFTKQLSAETYGLFTAALFKHFKFAEIYCNHLNTGNLPPEYCSARTNYILDINKPYTGIFNNYQPGFTKSLRRIAKFGMQYKPSTDIDATILLHRKLYGKRTAHLGEKDYHAFTRLCRVLLQQQQLEIRQATGVDGELLASVLLFKDGNRLYNIIACLTAEGRRLEANYFLYDSIIREFCNSNYILDLEGSDIKGIADFYVKLNPVNQPYPFFRYNHLHPLLKLVKK